MTPPTCWLIAGPNGAGKTTFALDFLPLVVGCTYFINADLIAAGLAPLAPERVDLVYLALPNAEMSALRVAERVAHGGHSIPEADILRRFPRSLRHLFDDFSLQVDHCTCFMNHGPSPELVFEQDGD